MLYYIILCVWCVCVVCVCGVGGVCGVCYYEWCKQRDANVRAWPDGKPPRPAWDRFEDAAILVTDDLPHEPQPEDVVIDVDFEELELSDHQKIMLLPVETRLANIVYPGNIQNRLEQRRKRKSKWSGKFEGHFLGKVQAKWAKKIKTMGKKEGVAEIFQELGPLAQVKVKGRPKKGKTLGKAKYKARAKAKGKAQAPRTMTEEVIENHPSLKKVLWIESDKAGEALQGRRGVVVSAKKVIEADGLEWTKLSMMEDGEKANFLHVNAEYCQEYKTQGRVLPLGQVLDWRNLRGAKLHEVFDQLGVRLHPENLEGIVEGTMVEHSTIYAGLLELEHRFKDKEAAFFSPQVCCALGP